MGLGLQAGHFIKLGSGEEDVAAIELKAPRASTADAKIVRGQIFGGVIMGAFSD